MKAPSNISVSPWRLRLTAVFLTLLVVLLPACATKPLLTPEASLDYGRFALRELPADIDLDALRGKIIVIDPGHGGAFPGAVGPNNLREADVNLGVALYLWGMLKQAGADAHLTRTEDSNVYAAADLSLKKDLQARARFAEEHGADLFVSLHHNADVQPGKKKNSLETYFKMGDAGPSLDLARSIHRQLAISLDQRDNVILPGNFHVLRENTVTAVLGEPSYITHARNAYRLGLAPMQRIEAQAYFLGIAEYFAGGVPEIEVISPGGVVRNDPRPLITARVDVDPDGPVDPASIEMRVDGVPVAPTFDRETSEIRYLPPERFANGRHVVEIALRNVNGNAARPLKSEFEISMAPAFLFMDSNFGDMRIGGETPVRVSARVFDVDLMPVADGTPVEFAATEGSVSPASSTTRNGEAVAYLTPEVGGEPRQVTATASASDIKHSVNVRLTEDAGEFFVAKVVDARTKLSVENALASIAGRPFGHSDRFGYLAIPLDRLGDSSVGFTLRGYEPHALAAVDKAEVRIVKLRRIAGGVLAGKRFVLDPQLGGEQKGAIGATGTRASDLNLEVATHLARFLSASGAEVALTRESDETVNDLRRVEVEDGFEAEWFVSIGHTEPGKSFRLIHYPKSELGRRLSELIAGSLRNSGKIEGVTIESNTHFVLTHTGSPAVMALGPAPSVEEIEDSALDSSTTRNEAYAIYCGILQNLGLTDEDTGRITITVFDGSGDPVSGATLALDEAFHLRTDAEGSFTFSKVTPGNHKIRVHSGGACLWDGKISVWPGEETRVTVTVSGPIAIWGRGRM